MGSAVAGILGIGLGADTTARAAGLDNKADLVGEYQDTIFVRNAKGMNAGTTLFGLMSKLKTEPAENSEYNWFERDPVKRELYSAAGTSVATSLTFATTSSDGTTLASLSGDAYPYLCVGHVLRNSRTGELVEVSGASDPDTNSITLTRGLAGASTKQAVLNSDKWVIITLGRPEGALPVRASYEEPDVLTNFIQTFNATVELSNAFKANKLRSDKTGPLKARRIQALERIGKDIELAYLFGVKRRAFGTNNAVEYFTGGIKHAVDASGSSSQIVGASSTTITLDQMNTWLESFMTYGSDAKLAFCGPAAYSAISHLANKAAAGFRIMNQESVWGMNVTTINTPYGEISLAFHPLFKEIVSLNNWLFVVDLAHIVQKTMEALMLEANIQTPGQDAYKEQFRAKLGLKLRFAQSFGYGQIDTITAT